MNYIELAQAHIAENYPHIVYPNTQIDPRKLKPGTICGSWAYSCPNEYRIITNRSVELAPGVLPADVTRAWLRDEYKLPLRRRNNQLNRNYALPIYAERGDYGDCSYVDIRGAYLTVLGLGYDVEYVPNRYMVFEPRPIPNEIAGNKFCYSIAVAMSTTKISNLSIVGKEENLFNVKKFNIYSNPCLYTLASDVLNGVCSEAIHLLGGKIHYANTDGFIVQAGYEETLIRIINSWGFEARVKHSGNTKINGAASWKCGSTQTKRFDAHARSFKCDLMPRDERLFLKQKFTKSLQFRGILLT